MRCYPMADSQLILELMFLHIRGGCSLTVLIFFLMLVGTCCFILHFIYERCVKDVQTVCTSSTIAKNLFIYRE